MKQMIFYVKNKIFFPFTKTVLHLIGKYGTGNREKEIGTMLRNDSAVMPQTVRSKNSRGMRTPYRISRFAKLRTEDPSMPQNAAGCFSSSDTSAAAAVSTKNGTRKCSYVLQDHIWQPSFFDLLSIT